MTPKEINSRKRLLKLELQGVNQLINVFFRSPQLYSGSEILELVERKKTLDYLINDTNANPFCNYKP